MRLTSPEEHQIILKSATEWFVAIQSDSWSQKKQSDFQKWLDKDPVHRQIYLEVEKLWSSMDSLKESTIPELKSARNALPKKRTYGPSIALTLLLAICSALAWQDHITPTYFQYTGLAENKRLFLADHSSITLNANTRIGIHESWIRRQVYLQEGEAQFTVQHEWRPFIVSTDSINIRDIGTIFNVRNRPESKSVTVLQGEVDLHSNSNWLGTQLKAGHSRHFTEDGELTVMEQNDEQRALAWLSGRLVFNHTPLNQVTSELERYHPVHFIFKTPGLAKQTITGNFGAKDLDSFLQALNQIYAVHIQRNQQNIEISLKL